MYHMLMACTIQQVVVTLHVKALPPTFMTATGWHSMDGIWLPMTPIHACMHACMPGHPHVQHECNPVGG